MGSEVEERFPRCSLIFRWLKQWYCATVDEPWTTRSTQVRKAFRVNVGPLFDPLEMESPFTLITVFYSLSVTPPPPTDEFFPAELISSRVRHLATGQLSCN